MRLKPFLLGSAAAAGIVLATAAVEPGSFPFLSQAQAATDVSVNISINTFYDRLSPYGSWISYRDRWVWVPDIDDAHWRPYTRGHWVFTKRHGWLWVSNERFGWATYHYGRWGYARDVGWYWVPGRRWAPAWVAWSRDEDAVAWAPLPPGRGDDVSISISIDTVPDYYWQVVPVNAFLEVDLSAHVVRDRDRVRRVISRGDIESVRIENNIVVNNVINVNFIEEKTQKKVVVHEEKTADSPEAAGKADDNSVAIFNAEVKEEPAAKPKEVKKVEEVAKEREAKGIVPEEGATESAAEGGKATEPTGEAATQEEQPAAEGEQQKAEEKKPAAEGEQQAEEKKPAAEGEKQQAEEKKPAAEDDQQQAEEKKPAAEDEQQAAKKKKPAAQGEEPSSEQALEPPAEQPAQKTEEKPAKKKQKEQCDPNTQDCANQ